MFKRKKKVFPKQVLKICDNLVQIMYFKCVYL